MAVMELCPKCSSQLNAAASLLKLEILHLHSPVMLANQLDGYTGTDPLTIHFHSTPFKSDGNTRWTSECLCKGPKPTCSNLRIQ